MFHAKSSNKHISDCSSREDKGELFVGYVKLLSLVQFDSVH